MGGWGSGVGGVRGRYDQGQRINVFLMTSLKIFQLFTDNMEVDESLGLTQLKEIID